MFTTTVKKIRLTGEAGLNARRRQLAEEHSSYSVVRALFGREADASSLDRVAQLFDLPPWAEGSVGLVDALFLYDMVQCVQPRRVLEVGVASGVSSAILLHAMADAGIDMQASPPSLVGLDLHPWCYFDRSRRVGSAVPEMARSLMHSYELHTGATAHDAGTLLAGEQFDLAFIDADHRHPAPTVDLLALLPVLRPGAWVILHDIDLPAGARRYERAHGVKVPWHHGGAQHLFDCWPFDKLRGTGLGINIGAVRLPIDQPLAAHDLAGVRAFPLECDIDGRAAALLGPSGPGTLW